MNKNVTRLLSLAFACALAAPTAGLARTVSVAAVKDGAATAAFGDPDGAAYTLAWGYGPADSGDTTNAWAHFETIGAVAADAVTTSVPLPAGWGATATHLRFFLLEPEIPAAATRVEYLESSGTQWINSGVNLYSNDTVVADYQNPTTLTKSCDLFGVYQKGMSDGMTARYVFTKAGTNEFHRANYSQSAFTTSIELVPGERQTVTMKIGAGTSSIVSASGVTRYSGTLKGTISENATRSLGIFNLNNKGSFSTTYACAAKIYSFKILDADGALRFDLVPCTVNGTPAMFDRVSGDYLYNVGTGDFATGATMATPLLVVASSATASTADYGAPDAYLDYVEATGTQYINSSVNLCSNDTVVAEYEIPAALTKTADLFGVHKYGMTARYVFSYSSGSSTIVFHRANASQGATSTSTGVTATPGTRQTVTMKIGPGTSSIALASGETLYSGTLTARTVKQDATAPLAIFACNSSENGIMAFCPARLYSFRIYAEDGSLTHNFLPCMKDNAAGLYDKATGKILFAIGGALVAGPVLPRPAELVEWVQSDGADGSRQLYIDTGIPAKAGVGMVAEMAWATKPAGYGVDNIFCGATSSAGKRIWLYDAVAEATGSTATHRFGYNGWKLQLQGDGNVPTAGTRYRVDASLAAGAQTLHVQALDGSGYDLSRSYNDSASINAERTLYLFANNNAGTAEPIFAQARVYSLVLTNELGLVRDFVPCIADNGRAGLYDRFSERVLFPQAAVAGAAADFDFASEVGAVTNVLIAPAAVPAARLSYVESNGASDFVDLGVIGRDGTKMVAEMEWVTLDTPATFCGAAASTAALFTTYRINADQQRMGYANGSRTIDSGTVEPVAGTRYRVTTTLDDGAQSLLVEKKVDGVWTRSGSTDRTDAGPMDTGFPLTLFARNLAGVPDEFAAARVYSLKLWQKDAQSSEYELVRDLVPAKGPEGGAALWDRVGNRFYRNSGDRYGLSAGSESQWIDGFYLRFW